MVEQARIIYKKVVGVLHSSTNTENFKWGEKDAAEYCRDLDAAYREVEKKYIHGAFGEDW